MERRSASLASVVLVLALLLTVAACGSPESGRTQSQPSTSPKASPPPASPAAASYSPSAKPASAEEQTYQNMQASWKQVVAAAQKEGPATIYSAHSVDLLEAWSKIFNKIDPKIQVSLSRQPGGAAVERLRAEASTKQFASNAYMGGSPSARGLADLGLGQIIDDVPALYEPGTKWVTSPFLDRPHETQTYALDKYQFLINTNLVPAGQEPKTWKDLADPKWKDKLVVWDPRLNGIGQTVLGVLYADPAYGPDVARKILENLRVTADPSDGYRQVVRGEMAMTIASWGGYLTVKDGPVTMASPRDATISSHLQFLVVKNAPQPNTTKVFANWLFGKEGQKVMSEGFGTVRADVDPATKQAQAGDVPFMTNVPLGWDFESGKMKDGVNVIKKWTDELGK